MRLIPLTSSQVAAIGYTNDPAHPWGDAGIVVVQFQKGGYYRYDDVPMWKFVAVITDEESQGQAFHRHIKQGQYPYREVTPEEVARL